MKVILYARVSTEEQAKHGWSIGGQLDELKKYVQQNNHEIIKEYVDPGHSGRSIERPALIEMLEDIKTVDVDLLLVWRLDRLTRDDVLYSFIKMELLRRDIRVISITEAFDDSPMGEFMEGVLVGIAKLESRVLSLRTKLGIKKRLESGKWVGPPPLGYRYFKVDGKHEIAPDPDAAPYIKQIFKLYSTGKYSFFEISELMRKRGFTSGVGRNFSNQRIKDILQNEFYVGTVNYKFYNYEMGKDLKRRKRKKGSIAEVLTAMGTHQPIIDKWLFERVQRVIVERGYDYSGRKRDLDFLLRGLLWCDDCGQKLTAERKKAKGIDYYHCIYSRNQPRCKQPHIQTHELEAQVEEILGDLQIKPEKLKLFEMVIHEVNSELHDNIREEKDAVSKRLVEIEKRENRLVDELSDKVMDKVDFQRHYARIKEERDTLGKRLEDIEGSYFANIETIECYIRLASKLIDLWHHFDIKNKKLLLKSVFKRFYVMDKRIVREKIKLTSIFEWITKPLPDKFEKIKMAPRAGFEPATN